LERADGIGLSFNLCVVPPRHYAGYVLQFWDGCQRLELDRGQTEAGEKSDRSRREVLSKGVVRQIEECSRVDK